MEYLRSTLYTILGVKHLCSKGSSSLLLQLYPYSVLFEFKICLLCDDIIDHLLGKQLSLIFILFLLNMVHIGVHTIKFSTVKCVKGKTFVNTATYV